MVKVALQNNMYLEKTIAAENAESFHVYSQSREDWKKGRNENP